MSNYHKELILKAIDQYGYHDGIVKVLSTIWEELDSVAQSMAFTKIQKDFYEAKQKKISKEKPKRRRK